MLQGNHLNVISVGAAMAALDKITPEFERASGVTVCFRVGNALSTLKHLQGDKLADVAILSSATWSSAVREGKIDPATRVDIAKGKIGIGVPAAASKPIINSAAEFVAAMRAAKSIALLDPKGGSGTSPQVLYAFERLGILNELAAKIRYYEGTGEVIGEVLADGDIDIGFTMISELAVVRGVQVVGPIPTDVLSFVSTISAAITVRSISPKRAEEFIKFLTLPSSRMAFRSIGFDSD